MRNSQESQQGSELINYSYMHWSHWCLWIINLGKQEMVLTRQDPNIPNETKPSPQLRHETQCQRNIGPFSTSCLLDITFALQTYHNRMDVLRTISVQMEAALARWLARWQSQHRLGLDRWPLQVEQNCKFYILYHADTLTKP